MLDVVMIGSGVGGLTAAALLTRRGKRVEVLEKNDRVGGILASYTKEGFKIDVGSHLVARGEKGPLGWVLRELGLKAPRFLRHPIPIRSRGMFEVAAPQQRWTLPFTALNVARALKLPYRDVVRFSNMWWDLLTWPEERLLEWDRKTLDQFLRVYTEHPGVYFMVSFVSSIFFVLPPWEVAAGEAIRALRSVLIDYRLSYIEGGMDAYPKALVKYIEASGGEVRTGHRVVAIRKSGEQFTVATEDGTEFFAPVVVCNMAPFDFLRVVGGIDLPEEYLRRLQAIRPSGNAHQFKIALRRPLVAEGCMIGGISVRGLTLKDLSLDLMRRTVDQLSRDEVPDPLAVYAPVPSNFDPSVAPPGKQLIVASVYSSNRSEGLASEKQWEERGLQAIASVIPHLMDEILFVDFSPVREVGQWMGRSCRSAISNSQCPGQVGGERLPVTTPIPGLFLCGDSAGGRGIGIELAASSGIEVANQLVRSGGGPE